MAKTARTFMTGLAFTVTLFTAGQAPASEDDRMALVLHVDNYARLSPFTLARAKEVATRIYASSGVRIVWVNGDVDDEVGDTSARHLRVLLLCSDMAAAKIATDRVPDNVLGQAASGAARTYIFTQRVRDTASRNGSYFDAALGRIIAHEVGHLLLPANSHSPTGIMRASLEWTPRLEMFTSQQAEDIKLALKD